MPDTKPLASLSLDLDNQWSYMKTHGDPAWAQMPSYLPMVVPRILDVLARRQLVISFFIVGQDAEIEANRPALRAIADAGHEIGNHSYAHEPWLHLYTREQLEADVARAEDVIFRTTGVRPIGFRGPGFSLSAPLLEVLANRGYRYDASVFPNLLNPLARAYFFATSRLSAEEKRQRRALFGTWRDALRPVKPFRWSLGGESLLEVPVTTMPVLRLPLHLSYIIYLAKFSRPLAMMYWKFSLAMCRWTGTAPSILLHPLDFLGVEDCPNLAFFPGMTMARDVKLALVGEILDELQTHFRPVTMAIHAAEAEATTVPALVPEARAA